MRLGHAALIVIALPPAQTPEQPRSAGFMLRIDASVVDGKGDPVIDLKPEELEVWIAVSDGSHTTSLSST